MRKGLKKQSEFGAQGLVLLHDFKEAFIRMQFSAMCIHTHTERLREINRECSVKRDSFMFAKVISRSRAGKHRKNV